MKRYKLTVHAPLDTANALRQAMAEAGAGSIGNYSHCSFSYSGVGRFMPNDRANPHIGIARQLEEVDEVSIEVVVDADTIKRVIEAIKRVHPYEEPAYEIITLVNEEEL